MTPRTVLGLVAWLGLVACDEPAARDAMREEAVRRGMDVVALQVTSTSGLLPGDRVDVLDRGGSEVLVQNLAVVSVGLERVEVAVAPERRDALPDAVVTVVRRGDRGYEVVRSIPEER